MKKIASFFMYIFICVSLLSGCNNQEAEGLSIAIVTSLSGIDDRSFNQNNYEGIRTFISANPGSTVRHIQEPTGDIYAAVLYVKKIAGDYDVIVMPGFQFSGIGVVAASHPQTKFILIDAHPDRVDEEYYHANVRAITFAEQESGFFAGIAAAMETQTGYVAFIGGQAFPAVVNYQFGFESGINYANKNFGTMAELIQLPQYYGTDVRGINIGGNYTNDFSAPEKGRAIALELMDMGADIIFVAAGGTGEGVFEAVKEHSNTVMVIGVDVDQFDDGQTSDRNIVLTSAIKRMDLNVHRSLESLAEGTFAGGNYTMHADSDSTGVVTTLGRHQMSTQTVNRIHELFGLLRDGLIVPASNFNGFAPNRFPGLN